MAAVGERPNIRIEIQNNLVEPMDVDDGEKPADSDFEDGEISDKNETVDEVPLPAKPLSNRSWTSTDGGFTTGVDVFNRQEQEKLQERANRFGLNPGEICNFTDEHLQQLHASLGITAENEKNIRFEAVHMRGTDEMSTEDVFEYFGKYGPASIEWISDESCNVVWQDKISAARAVHFISKAIKGMPVEGSCDPFAKEADDKNSEKEDSNAGRSILLKNREVQFEKEDTQTSNDEKGESVEGCVSISDINHSIPPGYWRLGIEHPKTKCILLRFAYKMDKKPLKAERFSDYYKKYGNPNFGGLKGLISESRRKKFKGIFDRNKDIGSKSTEDNKNPWGDLAENWDLDEQYSEKLFKPQVVKPSPPARAITNYTADQPDVMKRLGAKRSRESDSESVGSQENVKKKSKVPRMRMYADEEEEKMKRRKQLQAVKLHQSAIIIEETSNNNLQDLRSIIGTTTKKPIRVLEVWEAPTIDSIDLGTKLKNRTRVDNEQKRLNHQPEIPRSTRNEEVKIRHNNDRSLTTARHRSPTVDERRARRRRESPAHRRSTRREYDRSRYKNKLHSDRYGRRRRSLSDEGFDQHKPKSKVAVVIKTQKRPAVASTIWSRITPKKERLKTASERLQPRKESSSSSSDNNSSSSSSSSSESSSSESSSESEEESNDEEEVQEEPPQPAVATVERPGFRSNVQSSLAVAKMKSPLRIEINNDHFKEE